MNKSHHTPTGFKNNYLEGADRPLLADVWKWQQQRRRQAPVLPPAAGWASVLPTVKPDLAFLQTNRSEKSLTWLGHTTMLLQIDGLNIITDPVFSERASPVQFAGPKRNIPLAMTVEELPAIDVVFVSHNHYDHLDLGTIRAFKRRFPKAFYIVPLGLKKWFTAEGISHVRELDWWDEINFGGLNFTFVPGQHWSKRTMSDTNQSLWGGIVIETKPVDGKPWRFIYTGDTGYSQDFKDIGAHFKSGFDWAAIPIGAYEPRWFMRAQHVNPDEAVQMFLDLGVKQALAVHWGIFILTDEPLDQPPKDLAIALAKYKVDPAQFHVFKNGEMRRIG